MTHAPGVKVLETERLVLRRFTLEDAPFVMSFERELQLPGEQTDLSLYGMGLGER